MTAPSRFLFTCWPFEGHVFPQMSIAIALRDQGHEVAFYTAADAHPTIAAEGFTTFGFEQVDRAYYDRVQSSERKTGGRRQSLRVQQQAFRRWLVETIPGQVADLRRIIAEWQPDVIVTDLAMWGPIYILGESIPIPVALSSTFMGPLMPGPDAPPFGFGLQAPRTGGQRLANEAVVRITELLGLPMRRRLDALRADNGLGPMGCSISRFPARLPLYLVGNLRELDYDRHDLPGSVHYVGPCIWHPPEQPITAAWLDGVPAARPWVHVTEGTSHFQDPFVLRAAAHGLKDRPYEVILTSGAQRDPETLGIGPFASNVHATRWLSHSELLPRCDVVVTTGGPATIMASLRAGVPLVIIPTTWDKPDNASRVVAAGAGLRLSPRHCSPETLRVTVERVLHEPSFHTRAQAIASRLAAAPGASGAAHLLDQLASRSAVLHEEELA